MIRVPPSGCFYHRVVITIAFLKSDILTLEGCLIEYRKLTIRENDYPIINWKKFLVFDVSVQLQVNSPIDTSPSVTDTEVVVELKIPVAHRFILRFDFCARKGCSPRSNFCHTSFFRFLRVVVPLLNTPQFPSWTHQKF